MLKKISENYLVVISLLLYISSLFFVAITGSKAGFGQDPMTGLWLLGTGWIGTLGLILAWYANLLYIISIALLFFKKFKAAFVAAIASMIIGLQTLYFTTVPETPLGAPQWGLGRITLNTGFYLWELSFLILSSYTLKRFLTEMNASLISFLSSIFTSSFSFLNRNKNWFILTIFLCGILFFLYQ